jgi:hypothetical protein
LLHRRAAVRARDPALRKAVLVRRPQWLGLLFVSGLARHPKLT